MKLAAAMNVEILEGVPNLCVSGQSPVQNPHLHLGRGARKYAANLVRDAISWSGGSAARMDFTKTGAVVGPTRNRPETSLLCLAVQNTGLGVYIVPHLRGEYSGSFECQIVTENLISNMTCKLIVGIPTPQIGRSIYIKPSIFHSNVEKTALSPSIG